MQSEWPENFVRMLKFGFLLIIPIWSSVPATARKFPFELKTTEDRGHKKGLNDLLSFPSTAQTLTKLSSPAVAS